MWYLYVMTALMAAALIAYIIFYNKEKKSHFAKKEEKFKKELDSKYSDLQNLITASKNELKTIENDIQRKYQFNEQLHQMREEELDRLMEEEKNTRILQVKADVQDWAKSAQEAAKESFILTTDHYQKEIVIQQEQLKYIIQQLAEFKAKQDAVNEEILRRRALEEKQDFYRIQLTDAVKDDIEILNEIRPRLSSVEIFNKFIYDNYISRPLKEMVQRVLSGRNPSGIYKVTNTETQEIYIGKSVKVADRWQNHVKAAAGLGGVAESQFQRALKKYGVDKFTWELIEEVDKDKLTEREKYYINFYNTKQFGYNQREG